MVNNFIPKVMIFCGNFSSKGVPQGSSREIREYQGMVIKRKCWNTTHISSIDRFNYLADLISRYPFITRTTHFIFVPGPTDLAVNSTLPRRPLLASFVSRLKQRVPKVHFATNPCRIKFCDQEIVIFREDIMARMLRNLVGVKPDVRNDDLKRYVCNHWGLNLTLFLRHMYIACANNLRPKSPCTVGQQRSTDPFGTRSHTPAISSTKCSAYTYCWISSSSPFIIFHR